MDEQYTNRPEEIWVWFFKQYSTNEKWQQLWEYDADSLPTRSDLEFKVDSKIRITRSSSCRCMYNRWYRDKKGENGFFIV